MRVDIIGKGAIGLLLTHTLQQTGHEVQLLVKETQKMGFTFTDIAGESYHLSPEQIPHESISQAAVNAELVIVPTKSFHVIDALNMWRERIAPNIPILILCNGIGVEQDVLRQYPNNPVIRGITNRAALKTSPRTVTETGKGNITLGWLRQPAEVKKWQQVISQMLDDPLWQPDIFPALWQKVAINSVINPLTALHDISNGDLALPQYQSIIKPLIGEIATLFDALQLPISEQELTDIITSVIANTAANYSSMHQDVHHHKPTEVDYILAPLLAEAQKRQIEMPHIKELYQQVQALAHRTHQD